MINETVKVKLTPGQYWWGILNRHTKETLDVLGNLEIHHATEFIFYIPEFYREIPDAMFYCERIR